MELYKLATIVVLSHVILSCERYGTVELTGSRAMFLPSGIVIQSPSGHGFLVLIDGSPAEIRGEDKILSRLRAGYRVSLRVSEEPDERPILLSDITKDGEFIVRCKSHEEADQVLSRLQRQ